MVPGPAGFPLSRAVRVGDTLYVSGNFGWDAANSRVVPGGAAAETRQTLENMGKVLRQAGSSFDKVVKTTVMRHTSILLYTDIYPGAGVADALRGHHRGEQSVRHLLRLQALPRPGSLRRVRPARGSQGGDRGRGNSRRHYRCLMKMLHNKQSNDKYNNLLLSLAALGTIALQTREVGVLARVPDAAVPVRRRAAAGHARAAEARPGRGGSPARGPGALEAGEAGALADLALAGLPGRRRAPLLYPALAEPGRPHVLVATHPIFTKISFKVEIYVLEPIPRVDRKVARVLVSSKLGGIWLSM